MRNTLGLLERDMELRDVVCLREQWLANASAGKDFLTSLMEREIKIAAYGGASGNKISEAIRVATIKDHASEHKKLTHFQSPLDQRRTADALTLWIRGASHVLPGLFRGPVPVQVNAVGDGGKGRNGHDKHSKGKGKGKDKNKS